MIAYINLDRSTERQRHMVHQFARLGLQAQRLEAVEGCGLTESELFAATGVPAAERRFSDAEIGCFLSHRKAWETAANGSQPYSVILEDDVWLSNDSATLLSDLSWIPKGSHLIKIDTADRPVVLGQPLARLGGYRLVRTAYSGMAGTAGYILSRHGARTLLDRIRRLSSPVDVMCYDPLQRGLAETRPRVVTPALCVQQIRFEGEPFLQNEQSIIDNSRNNLRTELRKQTKKPPVRETFAARKRRQFKIGWLKRKEDMLLRSGKAEYVTIEFGE